MTQIRRQSYAEITFLATCCFLPHKVLQKVPFSYHLVLYYFLLYLYRIISYIFSCKTLLSQVAVLKFISIDVLICALFSLLFSITFYEFTPVSFSISPLHWHLGFHNFWLLWWILLKMLSHEFLQGMQIREDLLAGRMWTSLLVLGSEN